MNFTDIQKHLQLAPAELVLDAPSSKGAVLVAGQVSKLGAYLQVPGYLTNDIGYKRRLMFQFNFSLDDDFYIPNHRTLNNFSTMLLLCGCICIKYRAGTEVKQGVNVPIVKRYRLLDYRRDSNWSNFPLYNGELIKKNFCLEFWMDDSNFARGITQPFMIQTSAIKVPNDVNEVDAVGMLDTGVLTLGQLAQQLPLVFPIDWSNEAYLDN